MMNARLVENITNEVVDVILSNGIRVILQPGKVIENVNVANIGEISSKVRVVYDLSEVR